jgi:hypothetical protein
MLYPGVFKGVGTVRERQQKRLGVNIDTETFKQLPSFARNVSHQEYSRD